MATFFTDNWRTNLNDYDYCGDDQYDSDYIDLPIDDAVIDVEFIETIQLSGVVS